MFQILNEELREYCTHLQGLRTLDFNPKERATGENVALWARLLLQTTIEAQRTLSKHDDDDDRDERTDATVTWMDVERRRHRHALDTFLGLGLILTPGNWEQILDSLWWCFTMELGTKNNKLELRIDFESITKWFWIP